MNINSNYAIGGGAAGFMKKILGLLGAIVVVFVLSGCYGPGLTPRETGTIGGAALGAGGGALIGSTVGAPGTGAIIGGLGGAGVGYLIGNSMQHNYYRYPYYY
jgi:osmotically inducible lipoprotein OsmB